MAEIGLLRRLRLAAIFAVFLGVGVGMHPWASSARADGGEQLAIYVLTMGPGDHPFFKFGHNAIWVQDRKAGVGRVYNFGTFAFNSPKLIPQFVQGRLTYWLSVSSIEQTLAGYQSENRSIDAQELDLSPADKQALAEALAENARPENRAYKYDYFYDNCSTRVRDAIDRATGGRLRAAAQGPARMTLRAQALRLTADLFWEYLALYLVLGPSTDRPIDRWTEMFIPQELARGLRAVRVADTGASRPLVRGQQAIFRPRREPPLEHPPERRLALLLGGMGIGTLFVALGLAAATWPLWRVLFSAAIGVWGLAVGFVGSFLLFVWAFTDHLVAASNENILQCAPWALALPVLAVGLARGRARAARRAYRVAAAAAALAAVGFLLRRHPSFHQDNWPIMAAFLPSWIGIVVGLLAAWRGLRAQQERDGRVRH